MTEQPINPRERCGKWSPAIGLGERTECVLHPGHSGSHADDRGARWTTEAVSARQSAPQAADGLPEGRGRERAAGGREGLRQRLADALYGTYGQFNHHHTYAIADAVLAVVEPELRIATALHRSAEGDLTRVIALAERWRHQADKADSLRELVEALGYGEPPAPAHNAGPTVAECAEADARWWGGEKTGEGQ